MSTPFSGSLSLIDRSRGSPCLVIRLRHLIMRWTKISRYPELSYKFMNDV